MAVNAISAARTSRRNRYKTAKMRTAAISSEFFRLPRARSMKFAGRCNSEYRVMPCDFKVGASSFNAFSTASVAVSVLAPY